MINLLPRKLIFLFFGFFIIFGLFVLFGHRPALAQYYAPIQTGDYYAHTKTCGSVCLNTYNCQLGGPSGTVCVGSSMYKPTCDHHSPPNCTCPDGGSIWDGDGKCHIRGICRWDECPDDTDCDCLYPYKVEGRKGKGIGGSFEEISPYSNQTVSLGGVDLVDNPFSFGDGVNNLVGSYAVSVTIPPDTSVGYTICYNDASCHDGSQTPTPGSSYTIDYVRATTDNYVACTAPNTPTGCDPYHYVSIYWHFTETITPTSIITLTPTPTPTTAPGNWYKIKDASFHKLDPINLTVSLNVQPFDGDDDDIPTNRNLMTGAFGIGTVNGDYNVHPPPAPDNMDINQNKWLKTDYSLSQSLITNFFDYVKARKEHEDISGPDLSKLKSDQINYYNGNVTIKNVDVSGKSKFILIVNGDILIDVDSGDNNIFNSTESSFVIYAYGDHKITFSSNVDVAKGLFVANQAVVATTTRDNGFKIKGNLATSIPLDLQRTRVNKQQPTFFVVLNPSMYIELLPLLSTTTYDWQQTQ